MSSAESARPRRLRRFFLASLAFTGITTALLLLVEGASSAIVFVKTAIDQGGIRVQERLHTIYDAELGWVNEPSKRVQDIYGPGTLLETNARGFRSSAPLDSAVPVGRKRVVCSGDSFTLGYGVSNGEAWCDQLQRIDPSVEPVNMGQGGYGVDQAYLWYIRDSRAIDHNALVFAFISDDFRRMQADRFLGYAKPTLALVDGKLQTQHVPVPRLAYRSTFLTQTMRGVQRAIRELRVVRLLGGGGSAVPSAAPSLSAMPGDTITINVSLAAFAELARVNKEKQRALLLVYLPTRGDTTPALGARWLSTIAPEAAKQGLTLLDLSVPFRALSADSARALFLPDGHPGYPHYSVAGHEFVARHIHEALRKLGAFGGAARGT